MPELTRTFNNFEAGELTYHQSIEGGELTAQEMLNLRVNTTGELRQRHSIRATLQPNENNITGIASAQSRLFFITDTGKLFYRNNQRTGQKDTEIPIHGRPRIITETNPQGEIDETHLQGRISIIYEYKDFILITSEGIDQGYWIDIRKEDDIKAYPLGFNPPDFTVKAIPQNTGGTGTFLDGVTIFYRFTYIRDTRTPTEIRQGILPEAEPEDIPFDEAQDENPIIEPFFNVESNPSQPILVDIPRDASFIRLQGIKFPNPDGLERGIAVYRSRAITTEELERGETGEGRTLDYRRIGFYETLINPPPGSNPPAREEIAAFDDHITEDQRSDQPTLRTDNDRMPSKVQQFTLYNDRIYAPNRDELRYSDLRFGNPTHWAFPKTNAIRRPVDARFASTYRDMLLFGGRNGTWRVVGNPPLPDITRISTLGAIDPYALTTTEDVFGYISPAGLHLNDGVQTQDISEPIQAHFENQAPTRGNVLLLPNGHSLFSVEFAKLDGSLNRQTFYRGRQFTQWADLNIEQSARFDQAEVTGDIKTIALIAEDTAQIRQILWDNNDGTIDSINTTDEPTPISWKWKSHKLEFEAERLQEKRKKFTKLMIQGHAENPVTTTFTIYDTNGNTQTLEKEVSLTREYLYNTVIPIQRIGIAIQFEVKGTGDVAIDNMTLKGNI